MSERTVVVGAELFTSRPESVGAAYVLCVVPGACCDILNGDCTSDALIDTCQGAHLLWFDGATCDEIECTEAEGACCDPETFGTCTQTRRTACDCAGCQWHKLQSCEEIDCLHTAIPTTSPWGLLALTLLLLIGAKTRFARPQLRDR